LATSRFRLTDRFVYLGERIKGFDLPALRERARASAKKHGKTTTVVLVDMLWSAAFRDTAFQDYVDWDFPMLTRAERATFMTHPISGFIAEKFDAADKRPLMQNKITFNRLFNEFLGREWLDVREASVDQVRDFVQRKGTVMGKVPVSSSGHGVTRYTAEEIDDWDAFRTDLLAKDQQLLEEYITQHPVLAEICAATANTTRVTTFFDGTDVHILSMAQKFGRGAASDQQTYGGFYTMLDHTTGHSKGRGYDSHDNVWERHPESGVSIPDFQLPNMDEIVDLVDRAARVVPEMQYIGWDIVVREHDAVIVEGNWGAGVYENKPSVTGVRTGSRPRYREIIGF